ncbi:Polysaccharide deacetylase [Caballeronia sp. SBC1]|uniref:polysaccharide deacetylase family protein n=1 Tax=unclassified Caballeronia TaxID=2646786 RepID=UPI0013E103B1|nr:MULTISPECIES: polysaccharide deacetylase family protein [unclassified Caballeronia]QIE23209.1 Polysaccharide deacetylase [Caballeronia sp. SBC2]QIN61103.1 Polysaccharide deacetylase [Caballeronia sp. SBC1]
MSSALSTARAVPVLMYHHVSPSAGAVTVSPVHFADQMAMLAREGYTTLGARAFSEYLAGKPVPSKSVVLTFDDGYLDNWVHAHPVLAEHGFTALGFLVSGWVNSGPVRPNALDSTSTLDLLGHSAAKAAIEAGEPDQAILRWSEIDAMRQAGTFEFHSHTHTHTRWDRVSANADTKRARLRDDLLQARAALAQHLGDVSDHLCWPQGYFDTDYVEEAHAAGFRHLYTVEPGTNPRHDNPARILRLDVRDKPATWLKRRLWVHSRPLLSRLYLKIK